MAGAIEQLIEILGGEEEPTSHARFELHRPMVVEILRRCSLDELRWVTSLMVSGRDRTEVTPRILFEDRSLWNAWPTEEILVSYLAAKAPLGYYLSIGLRRDNEAHRRFLGTPWGPSPSQEGAC